MKLQRTRLKNETIEITNDGISFLGPDLCLEQCTVNIACSSKSLVITNCTATDCVIHVKRKFTDYQDWCSGNWTRCRFFAMFEGNDFGFWEEQDDCGSLRDCDFSDCKMHSCRFFGCDLSTIVIPPKPVFAILHPSRIQSQLLGVPWPGR